MNSGKSLIIEQLLVWYLQAVQLDDMRSWAHCSPNKTIGYYRFWFVFESAVGHEIYRYFEKCRMDVRNRWLHWNHSVNRAMDRAGDFLASLFAAFKDLIKPGLDLWEVEEVCSTSLQKANLAPTDRWLEGSHDGLSYATCCGIQPKWSGSCLSSPLSVEDLLKVDMVPVRAIR